MIPRNKFLSIIIPVHNEERRLSTCLETVIPFIADRYSHEIIIVDNGSTDGTAEICKIYANTYQHVYTLHVHERGKGLAIKSGMLFATGKYRYMCDVDLSTPISELPKFIDMMKKFDVVIGSRELTRSLVHTTLLRRLIGRSFHMLIGGLGLDILDTQCGFKLFRDYAAIAVFDRLKLSGLAFDVEALYLAQMFNFRIAELPVKWDHNPDSRVRILQDSLDMARDVLSIPMLHAQAKITA